MITVSYKLSWKPNFSKQSQNIIRTECYEEELDPQRLNYGNFVKISSVMHFLIEMNRPYRATIGQILTVSVFAQVVSIASVFIGASTLKEEPWLTLPLTIAIYTVLRLIHTISSNWIIFKGNRMAAEMTGNLVMRLGHHIANLSPLSHKDFSSGNLKTMAITDAQTVGELVHTIANRGVGFIMAPVLAPFILYHFAGLAGILGFLSMLLMIPFSVLTSKKMMSYFNAEMELEDECTTIAGEWLKHQKTSRMMQANGFFANKINTIKYKSFAKARVGMGWAAFIFGFSTRWWVVPPLVMIAGSQWLELRLPIENIIGSAWYTTILTGQLMAIPELIVRGGKAVAAFKRLVRLLKEPQVNSYLLESNTVKQQAIYDYVRFQGVSLELDGVSILNQINLTIDLKKKTAIIGQLGAGKSSLLALLSGHLFASCGKIYIEENGSMEEIQDRATYENWRKQQVLVTQEAFVESSDIKNNIALQDTSDSGSHLLQSLYDVAMHHDIKKFKGGIYEPLGETGLNLSGGQKQRLNLARALYTNRSFLILDDPMSAVDEVVADHLWQRLIAKYQGFVITTHRMKYAQACDHVIILHQGRVVEQGRPEDLLNHQGSAFTRMAEFTALEGELG